MRRRPTTCIRPDIHARPGPKCAQGGGGRSREVLCERGRDEIRGIERWTLDGIWGRLYEYDMVRPALKHIAENASHTFC